MKLVVRLFVVLTIILMSGYMTHAGSRQDVDPFSLARTFGHSKNEDLVIPHFRQTPAGCPTPAGSGKEKRKIYAEESDYHDERSSYLHKQLNFPGFSTTIYYKLISDPSFSKPGQAFCPRTDFSRFSIDTYIAINVFRI